VHHDVDRVVLRDDVGVLGQRDRTGDPVLDRGAGGVLRSTDADLDDAVRARLGEAAFRVCDEVMLIAG